MSKSKSYCPAPWCNLLISPTGKIYTCYESTSSYSSVDQNLNLMTKNSLLSSIKDLMINNQEVEQCRFCTLKDSFLDNQSLRSEFLSNFPEPIYQLSHEQNIKSLDLSFSNLCNLKCIMCSSEYSSQWSQDKKVTSNAQYIKNNLYPLLSQIERIHIAGGEPFIQHEVVDFLLHLIKTGNTHINLSFNTNGTSYSTKLKDILKMFNNLTITVSIDGVGLHAEKIRPGVSWDRIEENILKIRNTLPHAKLISYTTFSRINILYFDSLFLYLLDNSLFNVSELAFHYLRYPEALSVQTLTFEQKADFKKRHLTLAKLLLSKGYTLSDVTNFSNRLRLISRFMEL